MLFPASRGYKVKQCVLFSVYMFATHAGIVNGYLERRLKTVSCELQTARSRLASLRRSSSTAFVYSRQPPVPQPNFFGTMSLSSLIKPHYIPVILLISLIMIATSDARMPKKHYPIVENARILHEESHGQKKKPGILKDVAVFSKNLYSTMGKKNTTQIVSDFQPNYDELNKEMKGALGQTLASLFEIRLLDLQQSVRHARAMFDTIGVLANGTPDCIFCNQKASA